MRTRAKSTLAKGSKTTFTSKGNERNIGAEKTSTNSIARKNHDNSEMTSNASEIINVRQCKVLLSRVLPQQIAKKAPEPVPEQNNKNISERRVAPLRQCKASTNKRSYELVSEQNPSSTVKKTSDKISAPTPKRGKYIRDQIIVRFAHHSNIRMELLIILIYFSENNRYKSTIRKSKQNTHNLNSTYAETNANKNTHIHISRTTASVPYI